MLLGGQEKDKEDRRPGAVAAAPAGADADEGAGADGQSAEVQVDADSAAHAIIIYVRRRGMVTGPQAAGMAATVKRRCDRQASFSHLV